MKCGPEANRFGEFVVKNLWDESVEFYELLAQGHWKAPDLKKLQKDLASLSTKQRAIVRQCVIKSLSAGLHRFLFALGEAHDLDEAIAVIVDGVNIADQSDGLHGETLGPDGWMARFSKYPESYPDYK